MHHSLVAFLLAFLIGCSGSSRESQDWSERCEYIRADTSFDQTANAYEWGYYREVGANLECFTETEIQASAANGFEAKLDTGVSLPGDYDEVLSRIRKLSPDVRDTLKDKIARVEFQAAYSALAFSSRNGSCDGWLALLDQEKALPENMREKGHQVEIVRNAYVQGYVNSWINQCPRLKELFPIGGADGPSVDAVADGVRFWTDKRCVPYQNTFLYLDHKVLLAATTAAASFLECVVKKELYLREDHALEGDPTPYSYLARWPAKLDDAVRNLIRAGIPADALPIVAVAEHIAKYPKLGGYGQAITLVREFGLVAEANRLEREAYDRGMQAGTFLVFEVGGNIRRGVIVGNSQVVSLTTDGDIERGLVLDGSPD